MSGSSLKVVVAQKEVEGEIAILSLRATNGNRLPVFSAGAHVDVHIAEGLVRQYSLCSSPQQCDEYRLAVLKEVDSRGGSKAVFDDIEVGQQLEISAPKNLFPLEDDDGLKILVAGGIGITPILSMAYALKAMGQRFELHYCFSERKNVAFIEELKSEFDEQLTIHDSSEKKFDPKATFSAHPERASLYTCGPEGFMTWVMDSARAAGYPDDHIHFEQFGADVETSGDAFEVYCSSSDQTVQVGLDQSIASALIAAGVNVDVFCEQGICGTCITDVLEGEPDHRDQFLTDEEKQDNDQMALCCSRAKSPRLVIDI